MEWTDNAIVISTRRHGETSAIATVLSRTQGRCAGLVRGGSGKTKRGLLQVGNLLRVHWRARLPEHLGNFTCELLDANAADVLEDSLKLKALTAACSVASSVLPEREPHPAIYDGFLVLLDTLRSDDWPSIYVKWELGLLGELGFGLDFSACASTGVTEDLIYVSPKSGKAVSAKAGEPYKAKLLALPAFLLNPEQGGNWVEIDQALKLTGYFLNRHVYGEQPHGQPDARQRFALAIEKQSTKYT